MVDQILDDINNYEGACSPNPSTAVYHNGSRVEPLLSQFLLLQIDVLQDAQHSPGVVWHTMVRPGLKVILEYRAPLLLLSLLGNMHDI